MATTVPVDILNPRTYTFRLESFRITDTRSLHNDTDFVSAALHVGANPTMSLPTKSMGDINNGTFKVGMEFANISVPDTTVVAFSYSILNTGFAKNDVEQAAQKAVAAAASKAAAAAAAALGGVVGGPVGSGIGIVGSNAGAWFIKKLETIIFANCDGSVAAGDHTFTGAQLAHLTSGGKAMTVTDENKGTDSPHGCGGNSHYFVTWSVTPHAGPQLIHR
ncbi:MAG: hypothetical protein M3Y32_03360 [Pseudomonadota bacterium]|nr:hypothetical protein [Pseudomonadota bacterium]